MAWASQRSRRAINYAFIVVSDRISGPSYIFPSYTWAPFQSNWGRAKTAVASNRAAAVSSMPYTAFQYCKVIWFYKSGHLGSSTRDTLKSCAVAPSGSSFAMTTSRWLPVLALSYFRQQVERVRTVSSSEKVTPSKSSQFFRAIVSKKLVRSSPVGLGAI